MKTYSYKHWQLWFSMRCCFSFWEKCLVVGIAFRWFGSSFQAAVPRTDRAACPNVEYLKGILQFPWALARVLRTAVLATRWICSRSEGQPPSFRIFWISIRLEYLIWFSIFSRPCVLYILQWWYDLSFLARILAARLYNDSSCFKEELVAWLQHVMQYLNRDIIMAW